jgi:hypothetical protein
MERAFSASPGEEEYIENISRIDRRKETYTSIGMLY